MSAYRKNILVGATVLVALVLLGWMILRFSDAPFRLFAEPQMKVQFEANSAEGLSEGSAVLYKGVPVGRVVALRRSDDQRSVIIDATVNQHPPPPGNVEAVIRSQIFGGGSTINLILVDRSGPHRSSLGPEPEPVGQVVEGQTIRARFVGIDMLPPEFTDLAVDLRLTSEEFRRVSLQFRESDLIPRLVTTVDTLRVNIEKAGNAIDSINSLVTDPAMRKDLQLALANFRTASESATRIGANLESISRKADVKIDELSADASKLMKTSEQRVDEISKQLGDRLTQVATILDNVEAVTRKLDKGEGTAARLLNDPALYENLLDTSRELNLTIGDFRRLVEQWEQEGLYLKLK